MAFRSFCVVLSVFPNRNPLKLCASGGLMGESDDDLLSRTGVHYHWRGLVSRSCSGWEGVVPRRYGRQTVTCAVFPDFSGATSKRKKCFCVFWVCESVFLRGPPVFYLRALQGYRIKPHGQLVLVSLTHYCASTPSLSTSWSSTTL